jgi:hypothetical protein
VLIAPCLPSSCPQPPVGAEWIHEIKHDGFRLLAWRDGARVRLITRGGYNWSTRFALVAQAIELLPPNAHEAAAPARRGLPAVERTTRSGHRDAFAERTLRNTGRARWINRAWRR